MKRHLTIINLLLITVAVYLGVKMLYKISAAQSDNAQLSNAALKAESDLQSGPLRPLSDYNPIIERNLFKTKKETGHQPKLVDIESLKPTSLKLNLLGTVTGSSDKAYAVIQDASKNLQELYKIGDTIQNATLKMILREKVVLRVNGKDEILEVEAEAPSRSKTTRRPRRPARATSRNITLERSQIKTAVQNINDLMQQARVRPHFANGMPDGLILTQIKPNSIFHNMGLRNGDIITNVDGNNIESVDDALMLYQGLQSSPNVQLQLKRRGRMKTIDYNIE